ncbi:hypothetical protein BURMUCF2_B0672 [Burkholderia multivorans CF2]|nr:hypothetical protein BURMUCF2_B0672 [Burkholderia multivorans CF2]
MEGYLRFGKSHAGRGCSGIKGSCFWDVFWPKGICLWGDAPIDT